MNTKMRVKSYEQIKREQEAALKQKKKAISDVLTSAKNNPKFAKLLSYSFTSLDKMITPPNSDARLNAKLVIEGGGLEVLRSIAQKNLHNEDICRQIANIICKLTSLYENNVDQELAQKFVEAKGHEAVIEILLSKDKGQGSVPLIKCLNNLCQVPQLVNKLLDAGLAETIKLVNDLYTDDIGVIRMNLDTMKKVSNQKTGREFLIKKGIVPSILKNVKKCCDRDDGGSVFNGLIVVDNICRNDEGKTEVKNADAPNILCDVVENFSESAKIINKSAKILAKIMTKKDLENLLGKIKNCSAKLDKSDSPEVINEIKDSMALVSNLMLVDDLGKMVCLPTNFDMLVTCFNKLNKIDMVNKKPGFVKEYMKSKKHFLDLFKRAFDYMPECLDDDTDKGQTYTILMDDIDDSIKKNWDDIKSNVEKLEKEGNKDGDLIPLKNAFKGLFTSYSDIIKQKNDKKNDEQKKAPKWIELLNYLVGDVIYNGKKYFGEDEKPNYAASNILKIADDVVTNYPDDCLNLPENLKKCFPYIKGVIGFSDNYKTLKNDLEVIYNTIKNESDESELKKDIIPVITKFMDDKYKFRQPNLVNLDILDDYLTPDFVAKHLSKKPDVKSNPNLGLNYVSAIDAVMAKPFYQSATLLKEVGTLDEVEKEKEENEELKEPKNEEVEQKIIAKGSDLLKKLIPNEEFLRQVKEFKKDANAFNPDASKVEDTVKLEDDLIYQNCALNVDEFFNLGFKDDFATLKDLIKKEINFIEGFKRLKTNENNPKYKDICDASNKRLQLQLGTLRKLEDQGIDKYGKTKDDKYKNLLKDVIDLNSEVINKSTDAPNLMKHLDQLRNNVAFLRSNEKALSDDKNKTPAETYISSLMKLLNKSLNDEDLCDSIIKTLIAFANKKPEICNLLVKSGCPRLLLQIMDKTQNRQLANDANELLKMICVSSKENAEVIGNQNILMKLFEIRSKFASVEEITKNADQIANELMKLPGQDKFAEDFIRDAIKEFHDNVQKDFKNNEVKQKILNNEEIINSFTSNRKAIEPILDKQFIKDLNRACDLTAKDPEVSITVDKLLTNEMGLLKKIKDNLPSKEDDRHGDVAKDTLKILLDKSNFEEPLLLSCKCLSDYVKDDVLYNKHLHDKINEDFVDTLFDIQDNYLDNPEIIKEINNILCYLSLRNPKLAECIIKKGGLAKVIEELKAVVNLNDPASQLLKLNGLKMLNSLLNNPKNLDAFLNAGGVDLINKIVKNEVDNTPKAKDDENISPEDKYLTKGTICTKTPEQLEEEEKLGINSFSNLGLTKEEADKKRAQLLNDEDKGKDSTSSGEDNSDDSDNYFVQCLKIINKGLDNGKNEFVDDKTVQSLTNLATVNFPDKHLFSEVATILSNPDVKLNPDAIEDLKDLMKLGLSNKAQFYEDGNVGQKVKAIEAKIADMLMNDLRYKTGFRNAILKKGLNEKPLPGKLNDDRFGDMGKRADDDDRPLPGKLNDDRFGDMGRRADDDRPMPGKLNDDRFGDMGRRADDDGRRLPGKLKNPYDGQGKGNGDNRPIPGKLKNRFGNGPKGGPGLNKYGGGKKRGNKGEPVLDNKKDAKKKKGIELFDNNGNKYAGTYKEAEPEAEKYELYDKFGNKLDGVYKKVPGKMNLFDKNGKKLDDSYKPVVADSSEEELYDKNGNKLRGPYKKLISPLLGFAGFDKDGNPLDGQYVNVLSSLPNETVYDKNGNKLDGIYQKDEPENSKIELFDKNGQKLDGTYRKIVSNAPHDEIFDKEGKKLDDSYKKVLAKEPCTIVYNNRGKPLEGKYINLLSGIKNEEVFDKTGKKLDGIFRKVDDDTPYVEAYDKTGKKLNGVYRKVEPNAQGEEVYDKNKQKLDGKYKKVIPDIPEGEAYDKNGNKMKGVFKKLNPKALIKGEKVYDKKGNKLDGLYRNLEEDTKGDELYDKNRNKLDGTYKKITGDSPKEDIYDKFGNKLGKGYRKLESEITGHEVFNRKGKKLKDPYTNLLASIPTEEIYDKNGNKIDGIYAREDEAPLMEIYDKKGTKLDGKYIKCLLGQAGIEGYDKNKNKLDGTYRKAESEEPLEELFDENGEQLSGTYKKAEPQLSGEDLYDQNGNKLDGKYKKILTDEPHEDIFDKKGNKLEDAYKKLVSDTPGTDLFDKNGEKLEGKYINVKSAFPTEEVYDKNKNKLIGIFRKIEDDTPYFEAYDKNGNKLDGVYKKADKAPGCEIYDKNGNKLDGTYNEIESDLPVDDIYDKLGNKLEGTFKKVDDPSKPGEEVFDKFGNQYDGRYRNIENDTPGEELYDEDGCKFDGTFKRVVSDPAPDEVFDIYGNKLDGVYRKLEGDLSAIEVFDRKGKKLDDKYLNLISSIPNEPIFDKKGNKVKAIYRKVEEDTPVDEAYDKFGNKLDGTYQRVDSNEPGIEIFDKTGNKLDGAYKKLELVPQIELYDQNKKKLDGTYKQIVSDTPSQELYDKNGVKLDDTYRKVISDIPEEELYDKNGNLLDGKYINSVSNIPTQELYDKNKNKVEGIFRKIENDTPYTVGYDTNGNKLKGVYKKNEPNAPGDEIYDKDGNKLPDTYNKVESGVPDEDVYDKLGNYLEGTFYKVDPESGLPGIEIYDKNGVKFDGVYRNVDSDSGEELFDRNGNKLDGTYKKVISDQPIEEVYDSDGNKLDGKYKKLESDFPGIEVYDKNMNKLKDKYVSVVSSLPNDKACDKNGKKLNGIFRKVNPNNLKEPGNVKEKPLPGKLKDRFGDKGKGGKGNERLPGKLKDRFGDKGGKGGLNRPLPGKLKDRFGPSGKGPDKNNGGGRKLGKPNVFDKNGNKKKGPFKKTDSKPPSIELYDKNKKRLGGTYRKVVSDKPVKEIYDKNGKKLDGVYRKLESDLPGVEVYDKNGNKLSDPYINVISCLPQTLLTDKDKNRLNGIYKKDDSNVPDVDIYDKNGKKMDGKYKKVEPEFPKSEAYDQNGNKLKEAYVKIESDSPGEEAYDKFGNKLDGIFKEVDPNIKGEEIYDKNGNPLGDNYIRLLPSKKGYELYDKNKKKLDGTYVKIPSSIPGDEVYDKNGNKLDSLFRKNDPDVPGEELYDKNGNKLDGTYKKISAKRPIELYDNKGNKILGLYRQAEPEEIPGDKLFDKKGGKLAGKFIKIYSDTDGFDAYDKNRNKLDGTYKKDETGVEPIIGYNQNGNKLDGIFAECQEEPSIPIFDKKGNKLRAKYKKVDSDTPLLDVYDKNGNKLDGTFKKDDSEEPENAIFDKFGNRLYSKYKKDDETEPSEELFDKNGKKLDGAYKKLVTDKPPEEVYDKLGNKLSGTFRKIDSPIKPIDLYDQKGNKLDGKYISPISCVPMEELYDKNKNKVTGVFRKVEPKIPGVDAYDVNGNKLKGTYKKVEDDAPGEEVYDEDGIKLEGKYRNVENDTPGEELFGKNGKKLDGRYKKVVGDPAPNEVFDKLGNKLDGTYRKVLSDLPAEELFDKNGNLLDDKYINVISSLPEEEYYDKNGNKIDGIYKKDEPETEGDEELLDEDGYKLDGTFKKVLLDEPNKEVYDKNGKKLDSHYRKVLSDVPGIDAFDKNGNKLDGKFVNVVSDIPSEDVFYKNGNKALGLFRKVDSDKPYEEGYDKNGNKLDGVYVKADSGKPGEEIYDRNGKKLDGKYSKIKSDVPNDEAYDQYGNKLDGTFKKAVNGEPGDEIYDKNGNKLAGTYRKLEKDSPSFELFDRNKKKLDGTYKKVIDDAPKEDLYDKYGNKIDGVYRKVESDLPGIDVYDKNKNKLDDKYANVISNIPQEQIFGKNQNKTNAIYRKIEPDTPVEDAYDKFGNKIHGSYIKANKDEPGFELYDKFGNKLDGTYKRVDSDGPSVEVFDKNGNKLDGTYKKFLDDDPNEEIFDKKGNKLDNKYRKALSDIPGEELYDKNGNLLDGKYVDIVSNIPTEEVFDKKGNKAFGLFRKVEPDTQSEELYDKNGNKLDGTFRKAEDGEPGFEGYNKEGKKLQGRFVPNEDNTPEEELYDKNKKKLDGTYKRILADSPKDDVYDRFGNKLNGTYRKLLSDISGVDAYDKNGNRLDKKYAKIISNLPNNEIFDKNGKKLKGAFRKNNPVPGKLNDDRFGDMGKRADDDGGRTPGKLKSPFDGQGKGGDRNRQNPGKLNDDRFGDMGKRADDDGGRTPGKLKNPFDGQGKGGDRNRPIPGKLKIPNEGQGKPGDKNRIPGRKKQTDEPKPGDDKKKTNKGKGPEGDIQDKNKLLTYISLATEPEAFKNLYADANPEICSFFNRINSEYKPVIDKILDDKVNKINELNNNKNLLSKSDRDNPTLLEPFNINSLPEKEKYDEGVVLSLAKLYNYIVEQSARSDGKYRPGKLNDDRFGDMGKRPDDDGGRTPGKLKNPFDGQGKGDKNRPIPGKLKNKWPEGGSKDPGLNKYGGKKKKGDEDTEKYNNLLSGVLSPEDPVNTEFVNNLEVLADPVYTPENYIFVKQYNHQMNKLMDQLGKFEDQASHNEEGEKLEVTENYLAHLNTLFNKAVPFMHDWHKEINNSAAGQYPDIKKEKEENLDTILNGVDQYYRTDEDADIKADATKNICDVCLNLLDDLSRDDILNHERDKKKVDLIKKRVNKLWSLLNNAVRNDDNNQLLDPNNSSNTIELLNKLDDAFKNKDIDDKKLREILYYLSKRLDNGENEIAQNLLDFAMKDLIENGDKDEEIKDLNMQTLTYLSKFPGLMKQIMKNPNIWSKIKKDYTDPSVTYKKRGNLANLINNASKSNYNIENMINNDPQGMKALLHTIIRNPVKSLDDGGREIAETEVDTLCNILKDRNNYKALTKGDILNEDDVNKLANLYKNLDPKLSEPLNPIIAQIKEANKSKKEKDEVKEDKQKLSDLEKRVGDCFDNHKKVLLKYASLYRPGKLSDDRFGDMGKRAEDDDRPIPGKLKNPFDGQNKGGDRNRPIPGKLKDDRFGDMGKRADDDGGRTPGKLKNPFGDGKPQNDFLKDASSLRKMSFVSSALLLHQADNEKVKSSLSSKQNPEISNDLNKILSLLRKNYNDMKTSDEPELNIERADNVHKCLNLLKKLSLAPDNHKPILEGGFMNFMEKLDDDYKLFKNDEPDLNNKNLGFSIDGKNVLQACSNSENAIPIISESPVFDSTIDEVTKLYGKPELIAANSDIEKLFSYDNVIFSNLCKNKNAFDTIFKKMGLKNMLTLGKKTGNAHLLDAILNMSKNYIKNTPNKEEIPPEILDSTFEIMNKSTSLNDRNPALMGKVLDIANILYTNRLKARVDGLDLIKSMNDDIDKFSNNHGYLNSCLNLLSTLSKDNPRNGQEALDCGLMKKLNDKVSNIVKEGPEKYEENKDNNEEDDNGYLRTCQNLSKLYNSLVHNDMNNVDKFNRMGITDNTIKMLDHFNNIVEPRTEEEKEAELKRKQTLASLNRAEDEENPEDFTPSETVRNIMKNCAETLELITVPPSSNDYLATKTTFGDTINKTLENKNNETDYLKTALHALKNHLSEIEKNISKVDLPKTYQLCKNLQSSYYSNPEILTNINCIAGALAKNLKDDNKGKEYTKKFYDLIPENMKAQDYNPDLVLLSLKLMNDALEKKPYLVDETFDETVPNVLNLLKLYKDNPEIQENGYKILSSFAKNNVFSTAILRNGLLDAMKDTLENTLFSDSLKENVIPLKSEIFKLLNTLSSEKENCPKVADDLMGNLIGDLIEKGYNDEGKLIVPLLNNLCMNKDCIPPFVQYNGIDACISLLNNNDSNIELISNVFNMFKNIANTSDEYKKMLQDKKVPDLINRIIKKMGPYDKKLEFEGRQLLFTCNLCKVQLEDPNSIGVDEIKIIEPIPPEVRNFLTNGKQVKVINDHGDIKDMQLIFSQDLMKVSAKKPKSNLPPKPKYIIDTPTIKKILKGHGTDAFKKSKGLFRKIPPPEICFSIIGPTTVDGTKSINVECENEKEVDRWIKYLQIVINYFKKTHTIKGTVIVKK